MSLSEININRRRYWSNAGKNEGAMERLPEEGEAQRRYGHSYWHCLTSDTKGY